jgi:hypothetical protein
MISDEDIHAVAKAIRLGILQADGNNEHAGAARIVATVPIVARQVWVEYSVDTGEDFKPPYPVELVGFAVDVEGAMHPMIVWPDHKAETLLPNDGWITDEPPVARAS